MNARKENSIIDFNLPQNGEVVSVNDPRIIKVIGVGGGGGNAVARMYEEGLHDVRFEVCNTDHKDLVKNPCLFVANWGRTDLGREVILKEVERLQKKVLTKYTKCFLMAHAWSL